MTISRPDRDTRFLGALAVAEDDASLRAMRAARRGDIASIRRLRAARMSRRRLIEIYGADLVNQVWSE